MMNLGNRHSQHSFAQIPNVNIARSSFDRSFGAKDTFNFDKNTPCFVDEVLPGDTINLNMTIFARLATQLKPVMDNMFIDFFFFFVPNRIVWDNWEKLNGAQTNPGDSTSYLVPQVVAPVAGFANGSIYDHMGIPTDVPSLSVNALPFRAWNLIYNDWFRDQNLNISITVPKGDGPDAYTNYSITPRAKLPDYSTSCLPWPQKGAAVGIPLGTSAPVKSNLQPPTMDPAGQPATNRSVQMKAATNELWYSGAPFGADRTMIWGLETGMYTDLSAATTATINQLRLSMMTQSLLELDARGGTRYVEILRAHFNVVSPDFRLQRPEFLSAGKARINQHPVAQTSETATSPQGNLAAFSTASQQGIGFSKSFVEHGFVIGMMCARGEITYQQGLNRFWSRRTRFDYFWPKLQELGEQAVLVKEIYAGGLTPDAVFGYQERYAEYRFRPSEIRGQFRSNFAQSLDVWHLAQEFATQPSLNNAFIALDTPIERALVTTDPDYPNLLIDMWFDYKHARPIMTYGVPATFGRF